VSALPKKDPAHSGGVQDSGPEVSEQEIEDTFVALLGCTQEEYSAITKKFVSLLDEALGQDEAPFRS
jgi:hypothetical protein